MQNVKNNLKINCSLGKTEMQERKGTKYMQNIK